MQALMIAVATLFNSLWIGALLALIVWALLNYIPNINATTRYAAWCIALIASLVLPLVVAIPQISVQHAQSSFVHKTIVQSHIQPSAKSTKPAAVVHTVAQQPAVTAPAVKTAPASAPAFPPLRLHLALPSPVAIAIFAVWIAAALFLLIRLGVNLVRLEGLKRDALPLSLDYREHLASWSSAEKGGRDVRLCVSDHIEVPVAVGLFDSMVLIPKHLLDTLSQAEIDQIALHELAHLRRADDWTNGLQRVIQAIFFFNPAILFMAQQLDLEREVACDDWVLHSTGAVRPYATCLTRMAEVTAWPHRALAAPGVFVTRRGLSVRVERLLRAGRNVRTSVSFGPAGAIAAALIVLFFVAQNVAPSFAFTLPQQPHTASNSAWHAPNHAQAYTAPAKQPVQMLPQSQKQPSKTVFQVAESNSVSSPAQTVGNAALESSSASVIGASDKVTGAQKKSYKNVDVRVRVPDVNVRVPRVNVRVPDVNVRVPETNVRVPAINVHVPGTNVVVPEINVHVPSTVARYKVPIAYGGKKWGSMLDSASCTGCDFSGVKWAGRNLERVALVGSDFRDADLHGANFSYSNLSGVDFKRANLQNVNFSYANLSGCDMKEADLSGAIFTGAHISGCDINVERLAPAQAREILSGCQGCNFANANLRGQDLRGISVSGDDFRGADLRGADMRNASFSGVDFKNARFDGARLDGATFSGCDFSGVDLRNVDLSHAQIIGSKITIMR